MSGVNKEFIEENAYVICQKMRLQGPGAELRIMPNHTCPLNCIINICELSNNSYIFALCNMFASFPSSSPTYILARKKKIKMRTGVEREKKTISSCNIFMNPHFRRLNMANLIFLRIHPQPSRRYAFFPRLCTKTPINRSNLHSLLF